MQERASVNGETVRQARGLRLADEPPPLAEAKLAPPRARRGMVHRARISRALDPAAETPFTLVAAPAGYGKTTAVRAWCAHRDVALAWVTLDAGDNDPVRMWTYIATAVDRLRKGSGRAVLQRLSMAGGPIVSPITELWNGVAESGREIVLVLDDLHMVTDRDCLASIDFAIANLPACVHIIALTRADPALTLGRLRAAGDLVELRAGELAFTASETRELLVEHGHLDLDAAEVELLRSRTEGWPAALVLAGVWLRGHADPHRAVRTFGGEQRFVAEYLTQEALGSLAEHERSFLLRACALRRFTAAMCDDVFGRDDSAAMLADLKPSNLLIVRLEAGGWYQAHSLFAEFACFRLEADEPGAEREIHRRAAQWLRAHGLPVEAVEHAAAAGDHELVALLLADCHLALVRTGRTRTLVRWAQTVPDDHVVNHPELAVGAATAATMIGDAFERRRWLHLAERARTERPERFTPYVEAVAAMVRASAVDSDVGQAVLDGRHAVAIAQANADAVLAAALAGYARALYLAGALDEAWAAALRAVEHPDSRRRAPGHAFARSTLALIAADRGRLTTARVHANEAKSLVGAVGTSRSWLGANASAALGSVLLGEGRVVEAERELAYAEHFFRDQVATVHQAWLLSLLARAHGRRGRLAEAEGALRLARDAIGELADSGRVLSLVAEVERELEYP